MKPWFLITFVSDLMDQNERDNKVQTFYLVQMVKIRLLNQNGFTHMHLGLELKPFTTHFARLEPF